MGIIIIAVRPSSNLYTEEVIETAGMATIIGRQNETTGAIRIGIGATKTVVTGIGIIATTTAATAANKK